ncbi:kinesin-like protein KIN-6 isoform X2 [Syzygium oleosum]|uniref:kinesin-like protein KIN-6 isoform X2 n=1 Tax=Syzygium oleosum TaxID=219896 RepID=UPI0024B9EDFF|nr:kinesin-like protein KIN-6 isoform X2 [Syzygium oleosum]
MEEDQEQPPPPPPPPPLPPPGADAAEETTEKSPPPCPDTVTVRRNPHRRARPTPSATTARRSPGSRRPELPDVSSFRLDEILSSDVSEKPRPNISESESENLKVYLRIRPPGVSSAHGSRRNRDMVEPVSRARNVWPLNPVRKKDAREKSVRKKQQLSSEICISVNDATSVTLMPPVALQESKRIKSEVYGGFSGVFSIDSTQDEVYKSMVKPLADDFLRGKSGMLAALGPSGSGKTHTVFGTPKDPGMVPLLLRQIFEDSQGGTIKSQRSFLLSMFEICSERGKGEKAFDLSNGFELSMQQWTLKGLQEVIITDLEQAESLIACGMLKRATAMTNTNSQSSRSQCLINIRNVSTKHDGEDRSNAAIMTIADLAGAERERRTGNQGTRLLESNFINNTSMVFGLCLRSLLEHQKNPKKVLQKHYQNSLLTRYLRDYFEGKKRMTLVLTVKPGEDDYLDASYLLRQASPYTKIKFNKVEESSNPIGTKRHYLTAPRVEEPKRRKYGGTDASVVEDRKCSGKASLSTEEEAGVKPDVIISTSQNLDTIQTSGSDRYNRIMQGFAKALWKVLKKYNDKLKVADGEIQSLQENLDQEKTRCSELEKELINLRANCTCTKEHVMEATSVVLNVGLDSAVNGSPLHSAEVDRHKPGNSNEVCKSVVLNVGSDSAANGSYSLSAEVDRHKPGNSNQVGGENFSTVSDAVDIDDGLQESDVNVAVPASDAANASQISVPKSSQLIYPEESFGENENAGKHLMDLLCLKIMDDLSDADSKGADLSSQPVFMVRKNSCSSVELDQLLSEDDEKSLDQSASVDKDLESTQACSFGSSEETEPGLNSSYKCPSLEKPKRRLLPASSILLRDMSALDVEDEMEKPKVAGICVDSHYPLRRRMSLTLPGYN